jgi:hypothetical protein
VVKFLGREKFCRDFAAILLRRGNVAAKSRQIVAVNKWQICHPRKKIWPRLRGKVAANCCGKQGIPL